MIFLLLRLIITFIVVYVVLTVARDILVALGLVRRNSIKKDSVEPQVPDPVIKPKEEYRDVQEAKFREIKDK